MDGTLLIFCDIVELNDAFCWRLEIDGFPFGVVGEYKVLHTIYNNTRIFLKIK